MICGSRICIFVRRRLMLDKSKRISSVLVLRGLLALIFGVLILALPDAAKVAAVIYLFGAFAIADGVFSVIAALAGSKAFEDWWLMLLSGALSILIGVFTFAHPLKMGAVLVLYIGFRAILMGTLEMAFAVRLRKVIEGEWLFILSGLISVLFGLAMIMFPIKGETLEGILVVAWLVGIYAIAGGAMLLVLAGQIREWVRRIEEKRTGASV
jgi:uncharacterized membrane protein HdeD (DUF308 family)